MRPGIHGLLDVAASPERWWALLLVILLPSVACSQASPISGQVVSSDAALQETANALLQDIAERSGLSLAGPVRVEWRSEEELVRYLTFKLDEEFQEGEVERIRDSYALLGLVPETLDLGGLFLALYTEQVAGFYDPDSVALYVRSGQDEETVESVLVHELVHAAQDQFADLDALTERGRGNDRQIAAQAAAEGHATLVMLEYALAKRQGSEVDLVAIPNFIDLMGPSLAGAASSSPVLSTAPAIVRESLVFPYVQGTEYVRVLWQRRPGRPPPFGELLPHSTEQVLEPERAFGPEPDAPLNIELSGGGASVTYTNSLGVAEIGILFEEVAGDGRPIRGWEGDQFALVEGGDGSRGLVWWSVWEDEAARDAFVSRGQAVAAALTDATLEPGMLDGRPAAVLTVGAVPTPPLARIGGGA
ncbi:MAG: hypothetical protein F4043_06770 [Gammaproteobacteria bacterium]|nr:hypothetical protein [Gammaproteobacteria bacterium]MYI22407.1 hypothetical protein [Gammaproteobacteria bacterium]